MEGVVPNLGLDFSEELKLLYSYLCEKHEKINRISVALFDAQTGYLKTYAYMGNEMISHYEYKLSDSESLSKLVESRTPRIVDDLEAFPNLNKRHMQKLKISGIKSSCTYPMFFRDAFLGLVFFDSKYKKAFRDQVVFDLNMVVPLITVMVAQEKHVQKMLINSMKMTLEITRQKDPETEEHLGRVGYYSQIIARHVAPRAGFGDEFIEHVFRAAPMHDIGKIAIPDAILHKTGALSSEEFELMKTHTVRGHELAVKLMTNFELDGMKQCKVMLNVIRSHHEKLDGSGYPDRLKAEEIPWEAKIVAVADIFDALTSERPYKRAWSNSEALQALKCMVASGLLDPACVDGLLCNEQKIQEIQLRLADQTWSPSK